MGDHPLPHRLVIYLPSSCDFDERVHQAVQHLMCVELGGATSYSAQGAYRRDNNQVQIESIRVLEAYCESSERIRKVKILRRVAAVLGKVMEQESVAIAVDGRMENVPPSRGARPRAIEDFPFSKLMELMEGLNGSSPDS